MYCIVSAAGNACYTCMYVFIVGTLLSVYVGGAHYVNQILHYYYHAERRCYYFDMNSIS